MKKRKKRGTREETERMLWAEFEKIKVEGMPIGPTAFAKRVGLERTYLYTFHEVAAAVAAYGRLTQPSISRRGAGVTAAEAKKRHIDARIRREHTQWAREIPRLQQKLTDSEDKHQKRDKAMISLRAQLGRMERAFELLLMLAVEAGISPRELEDIKKKVKS